MSEDLHGLVSLYAVDALDDDERRRFELHLADCESCRVELAEFGATTSRLNALVAENPPPELRSAIMTSVRSVAQEPPGDPGAGVKPDALAARRPRRAWLAPALAAAAAVVALVLGLGWAATHRALDRQEAIADVLTAPDATGIDLEGEGPAAMRLVYSPSLDRSVVVADGLADVPSDRTYVLWFLGPDGPEEISLFRTEDGRSTQVLDRTPEGYEALGVTEEPAGGSPEPTGNVVLSARL